MYNTGKYRAAARNIFNNIQAAFKVKGESGKALQYWHAGCSFDTMTDYLLLLKESSDQEDKLTYDNYKKWLATQFAIEDWTERTDPFAQYLRTMISNKTSCCYDDFSWWGIASSKALKGSPYYELFLDLFGEIGVKNFQNTAAAIWQVVYHGNYDAMIDSIVNLTSTDPKRNPNPYPLAMDYPGFANNEFVDNYKKRPTYHGGSPKAWKRVKQNIPEGSNAAFSQVGTTPASQINVQPRFTGGLWQYDYYYNPNGKNSKNSSVFPDSCAQSGNPKDHFSNHQIGPYQLTLMSGLGLIYACRMKAWGAPADKGAYEECATNVKQFIENWMTLPSDSDADEQATNLDALLYHYDPTDKTKALVRERVGSYFDKQPIPGYEIDASIQTKGKRLWSGDQGLILGGLSEYQAVFENGKSTNEYCSMLLKGSLDMKGPLYVDVDSKESFDSLQPYSPKADGTDWPHQLFRLPDYWSGTGVFWRYFFQSYRSNSGVKAVVANILKEQDNAIFQSAETAAKAGSDTNPTSPFNPWSTTPWGQAPNNAAEIFKWFNPLATLTAAICAMEDQK